MINLEFINKEITITKSKYKEHLKFNQTAFAIKDEKRLQSLQQIKTILEAWEIVKPNICKRKIGEERFIIQVVGGVYYEGQCWTSGINPYEIVKKALEVEE